MQLVNARVLATGAGGILRLVWLGFLLLLCASANAADGGQPVGEVIVIQGVATAQRAGETPRFLQKGSLLHEGEVLNTGGQGFAVIGFKDETKFTLRPNTTFTIQRFRQGGSDESAAFQLLKGGIRAITGLIAKRNPRAMEVNTPTATIGIRGTGFDARLCDNDCTAERSRAAVKPATPRPDLIVARVAVIAGSAQAIGPDGQMRNLSEGSALFTGDSVRTDKVSHVVLAFRDRSKITVIANSEFKLEDVRFSGPQSDGGNFAVRIVRGGIRALTGLLAKREPQAVQFRATTAVIGLRGTGLDARIEESVFLSMWEEVAFLLAAGRELRVDTGSTGIFTPERDILMLLDKTPEFFLTETAPRPDRVEVDFDALFGAVKVERIRGLTLGVTEGEVILRGPGGFIYLSRGESGYLEEGQLMPVRVEPYWEHHLYDPYQSPDRYDPRTGRIVEIGAPGSGLICEIR